MFKLFRVLSWFWGWGREKQKAPSSISLCSEEELKAQLHEARLKIAKIELKTGAAANVVSPDAPKIKDMDCYALEFKVFSAFFTKFLTFLLEHLEYV